VWLFRHDDVRDVLSDHERFRNVHEAFAASLGFEPSSPYRTFSRNQLITSNPPAHTRMKNASRYFTRQHVTPLEPLIRARCDALIDALPDEGEIEFAYEFAFKLPVSVIMAVLGLPESDEDVIHDLSPKLVPAGTDAGSRVVADRGNADLRAYVESAIAYRRAHPIEGNITTELIASHARGEIEDDELWGLVISLIVAGHGTTANALALGMHTLLHHRDQLELLRADPSLAANAAAEILRYEPPLDGAPRITNEAVTIAGVAIPAETGLGLSLASANHDPRRFADPERFDITRADAARHLAFGHGLHRCLGAPLAQLQIPIALQALLERLEVIEPAGEPQIADSTFRGLRALPLWVKRRR
jgi:cytochrome P450